MDKQHIISFIKEKVDSGEITRDEVLALVSTPTVQSQVEVTKSADSSRNLIHVFYAIGAIIAVIGVCILVAENWNDIGFAGRILVTLGISFATYAAGLMLRSDEQNALSQVMLTISAALAPLGVAVFIDEAGIDFDADVQLVTALILTLVYGTAFWVSKRSILTLITIGFASWGYYAFIFKSFTFDYFDTDLLQWTTMLLGAAYIFIGYGLPSMLSQESLESKEGRVIHSILYSLGTLAVLGAGIAIGGAFDLFYILVIFAAFYGSVYLKDGAMLKFGALFLMAHIIKITSKYFADSIGWPVALIGVGFLVIGVGYGTHYLNQTFIKGK